MDRSGPKSLTLRAVSLAALCACWACPSLARAEGTSVAKAVKVKADSSHDGVYERFDGDLDLGLALGAELGSAGGVAPIVRGTAHYFSIAGLYAGGRVKAGDDSAPSLFDVGVDARPLFVPRWAKGYETGPAFLDLTLDSLSLSLGAFWVQKSDTRVATHGFEAGLGFGLPLLSLAAGPWLEARGLLRYSDTGPREEALVVALAWHAFVLTPLISSQAR
ncbi:MAG TPA: hypothetical protein VNW92_26600 [Polyangiaceae bacterium]|nr:hypothetical protein [Polyangiaceae bacterium]